jgi:hypothetical protein
LLPLQRESYSRIHNIQVYFSTLNVGAGIAVADIASPATIAYSPGFTTSAGMVMM